MTEIIEVPLDSATLFQTTRKLSRKAKKRAAREAAGPRPKQRAAREAAGPRPKQPRKLSVTQKLHRKAKKKAKAKEAREAREIKMIEHLVKNGWARSGPMNDVWTIGAWKDGFDDFKTTLCRAYKTQLKLESQGYERPVGMDDDLLGNL
jgi:ribosomal protein L4